MTQTIGGEGNREKQQMQTINIKNRTNNRSITMRLMLTIMIMMMKKTVTSIRQLPHVYLPTGVYYL